MARVLSFNEEVMSLTAESKNDMIIGGYENGYLNVWDARCSEKPILQGCFSEKADVTSLVITECEPPIFYAASGKSIYFVDSRKLTETTWSSAVFECVDEINQIVISDNGQLLCSADDNNDVSLFDLKKNRLISLLSRHKSCVSCISFSPSKARQLISGGYDCNLFQWDVLKGRNLSFVNVANLDDPEWTLPKSFNPAYVLSCDVSTFQNDAYKFDVCVAGTENGNLHLFRCEKKLNHIRTFHAHDRGITQAKFVPNVKEELIVSTSNDMKIKTWKVDQLVSDSGTSYEPVATINHHRKINWLTFHKSSYVICDTLPNISIIPIVK